MAKTLGEEHPEKACGVDRGLEMARYQVPKYLNTRYLGLRKYCGKKQPTLSNVCMNVKADGSR